MKTEKELKELKEEYTDLNKKLAELSEDELKQVTGGVVYNGIDTDEDRSNIQKEIDASISEIDDNALL